MRALILIVAIVLLLAFFGWITFGVGPGRTSVNVETDQIRQDTREALESGAQVLRNAEDAVRPNDGNQTPAPQPAPVVRPSGQ